MFINLEDDDIIKAYLDYGSKKYDLVVNIKFVPKTARITSQKESNPQRSSNPGFLRVEFTAEFDGVEVYFPAKPSEATRDDLKSAGYRWHSKKKCWYAKNTDKNLQAMRAIEAGLTA